MCHSDKQIKIVLAKIDPNLLSSWFFTKL